MQIHDVHRRYEMSDDDLSQCGSGLEGLIEDEILEEENEDEDSQEAESDEEERNEVNVMKNTVNNEKKNEDEDSESVVLDSDIEEMLKENMRRKISDYEQNGDSNDEDDDDGDDEDDDDSEESVKSDLELDDIIQSGDYDDDNSSEDENKDSEEEELNYSALEEEEYDSEAFSFTGMPKLNKSDH